MSHHHHHHHHIARRSDTSILAAFLLNLGFSMLELVGGLLTGSIAILSDALHDLGDAAGIGLSFFLEKKSRKSPDSTYTYGYARYSALGGFIITVILLIGSCLVIAGAVQRILRPIDIRYDKMLLFAIIGVVMNTAAALLTRHGDSLNQRAVNLHLLEDVLGWLVVLVGAVVMRFTDWVILDPLMSMGVAIFILIHALGNLREVGDLFLERVPRGIDIAELCARLKELDGVENVHHIYIRSLDGVKHDAALCISISGSSEAVKERIRAELADLGIVHVTIETD